MRRRDKLANITRINKRMNESAFSWDGKYENEEDLEEGTMSLGDDMEMMPEEEITEEVTNVTTDISDKTQFFSDEDGERRMDNMER
jgi:hypothetical protein